MPYKLVGYLEDGLDKTDYLSTERAAFLSLETEQYFVQRFSKREGHFVYESVEKSRVVFLHLPADLIITLEKERQYLAIYNDEYFFGTKYAFIDRIARFLSEQALTSLNLFSIYSLLSLRYQSFEAAQGVIETNELKMPGTLTIQSFSFPAVTEIGESKRSLYDILFFYSQLAFGGNLKYVFSGLFERHAEDVSALKLNEKNDLLIGNYCMEANHFLDHLHTILIGLGSHQNARLIKKFIFGFLILFNFITEDDLGSVPAEEEIEILFQYVSNQKPFLSFDPGKIEQLIGELNPEKILGIIDCRKAYGIERQLAQ